MSFSDKGSNNPFGWPHTEINGWDSLMNIPVHVQTWHPRYSKRQLSPPYHKSPREKIYIHTNKSTVILFFFVFLYKYTIIAPSLSLCSCVSIDSTQIYIYRQRKRGDMGFGARLCLCLLLVFTIVASASARINTISFSGMCMHVLTFLLIIIYVNWDSVWKKNKNV